MVTKDEQAKWFVKNIVMPENEVIHNPGFVVCKFSDKCQDVFMREFFYPESIFVELEKQIYKKYGNKGTLALYSAGKNFGYNYSKISNFPQINKTPRKDFDNFIYLFMRYAECMLADSMEHKIDYKKKTLTYKTKNYVICSKNGIGCTMLGVWAGFWAYLIDDLTSEGAQPSCEGRGSASCEYIFGAPKYLPVGAMTATNVNLIKRNEQVYRMLNKIRKTTYSKKSFKDLIDSRFIRQRKGDIECLGFRHFLDESSLLYFLECGLDSVEGGSEILFNSAYKFGESLAKKQPKSNEHKSWVSNYLSAMGWGDVLISKQSMQYVVSVRYFPWTELSDSITYSLFRGMVSGLISGFIDKPTKLKQSEVSLANGYMTLTISE